MIPRLPFCLYLVISFLMIRYLASIPSDNRQKDYTSDLRSKSLALVGFSFTAFVFMVDATKEAETSDTNRLYAAMGLAVVSFLAAYLGSPFRIREALLFFSDAAVDNGFWCVTLGLFWLSKDILAHPHLELVFSLAMAIYWGYVLYNVVNWLKFAGRWPGA